MSFFLSFAFHIVRSSLVFFCFRPTLPFFLIQLSSRVLSQNELLCALSLSLSRIFTATFSSYFSGSTSSSALLHSAPPRSLAAGQLSSGILTTPMGPRARGSFRCVLAYPCPAIAYTTAEGTRASLGLACLIHSRLFSTYMAHA